MMSFIWFISAARASSCPRACALMIVVLPAQLVALLARARGRARARACSTAHLHFERGSARARGTGYSARARARMRGAQARTRASAGLAPQAARLVVASDALR